MSQFGMEKFRLGLCGGGGGWKKPQKDGLLGHARLSRKCDLRRWDDRGIQEGGGFPGSIIEYRTGSLKRGPDNRGGA